MSSGEEGAVPLPVLVRTRVTKAAGYFQLVLLLRVVRRRRPRPRPRPGFAFGSRGPALVGAPGRFVQQAEGVGGAGVGPRSQASGALTVVVGVNLVFWKNRFVF